MVTTYLQTLNKKTCYGCRSCELSCPKGAISIQPDDEGFLYPVLDKEKCIDCSLCRNVCPYDKPCQLTAPKKGYALKYNNEEKLINSSSGAAFPAFADYILSQGGYIVGCIFNENIEAVHVVTNEEKTVSKMSGSKYVQSDVNESYKVTAELLSKGEIVLYSGTPCQIAGLNKYLKRPYDNLYTIDLICHGVPSPALLKNYINSTYNLNIKELRFRDKARNGWCSQGSVVTISQSGRPVIKRISPYTDSYYYYYLQNSISRYCCYDCAFSKKDRVSDITIGDYWNVRESEPGFNADKGVSAVLVNTTKGEKLFDMIASATSYKQTDISEIVKGNGNLQKPCEMPDQRKYIYEKIRRDGYAKVASQECHYQYVIPFLKRLIPSSLKRVVKSFISQIKK